MAEVSTSSSWEESYKIKTMIAQPLHTPSVTRLDKAKTSDRHRPVQQNDSKKYLIAESLGSRPKTATNGFHGDCERSSSSGNPGVHLKHASCISALQGSSPGDAKATKPSRKFKEEGAVCNCSCKSENDRWQQGQWSDEEWETKRFTTKKAGMCKCIAGAAVDCTAVCCCPLSLLHLLALACIKMPTLVAIRTLRKVKSKLRRKHKFQEFNDDDVGPTTPLTPSLSRRESMSEVTWVPSAGFGDSRMWQEYFGPETVDLAIH
ncbi:uncharacterized protein [Physcomitrium patens]|uniref:uncharacterized protein isoform X1 n=1 Tax=Physcomitrium patens TaxID=3218 RepID=UPI000D152198|nr:uncharacterized protein LOC112290468 isoform X1 [Physcomitrium patens]|eukprot:XP_024392504.1 uncharacterized protein LOC112290468 isoform X1 [Physcomitrella patens]